MRARIAEADAYLAARTGNYEQRCHRYDAALEAMHGLGLCDTDTVVDVGSGWGEFGARLHTGSALDLLPERWLRPSLARYIPVDACIDGVDLETWYPPRRAEFFVALEIVEHLKYPRAFLLLLRRFATKGVIVSTPNPETTDVLGMDPTHQTPVDRGVFQGCGYHVESASFYGKPNDSLSAVWSPEFV